MKLKRFCWAALFFVMLTGMAYSVDFKILSCSFRRLDGSVEVQIRFDSQLVTDVKQRLSEGADYILRLDFETKKGKLKRRVSLSYNPITRLYVFSIDGKEERFRHAILLYQRLRCLRLILDNEPVRVRAVRTDPYMPFPFNLIPGLSLHRTDWVICHGRGREE